MDIVGLILTAEADGKLASEGLVLYVVESSL
jgi:hypothetical protein